MHVLAISLIHLQVRLVVFFHLYDDVICFFVNLKVKIVDYSTKFSTEPMNLNYCKCCKKLNQHLLVLRRMSTRTKNVRNYHTKEHRNVTEKTNTHI